ncbi:MAG: putative small lipoprotein YifL, partial [Bacteroidia bacterium]
GHKGPLRLPDDSAAQRETTAAPQTQESNEQ